MRVWDKREGAEDEVAAEDVSRDEDQQGGEQGGEAAASALNEAGRAGPGHAGERSGPFRLGSERICFEDLSFHYFFSLFFGYPLAKRGNFVIFHFDSVRSVLFFLQFFLLFLFCC